VEQLLTSAPLARVLVRLFYAQKYLEEQRAAGERREHEAGVPPAEPAVEPEAGEEPLSSMAKLGFRSTWGEATA
jgi:hypothetical protein